jgi:hypothetical protein
VEAIRVGVYKNFFFIFLPLTCANIKDFYFFGCICYSFAVDTHYVLIGQSITDNSTEVSNCPILGHNDWALPKLRPSLTD